MTQLDEGIGFRIAHAAKMPLVAETHSRIEHFLFELNSLLVDARRAGMTVSCLKAHEIGHIAAMIGAAHAFQGTYDCSVTEEFAAARDKYVGTLLRKGVPDSLLVAARAVQLSE